MIAVKPRLPGQLIISTQQQFSIWIRSNTRLKTVVEKTAPIRDIYSRPPFKYLPLEL